MIGLMYVLFHVYILGNIPAMTRLLQAYVKRGPNEIVNGGKLVIIDTFSSC